jgi:hypothetical protein
VTSTCIGGHGEDAVRKRYESIATIELTLLSNIKLWILLGLKWKTSKTITQYRRLQVGNSTKINFPFLKKTPLRSIMSLENASTAKTLLARHRVLSPSASMKVSPICLGTMNFWRGLVVMIFINPRGGVAAN